MINFLWPYIIIKWNIYTTLMLRLRAIRTEENENRKHKISHDDSTICISWSLKRSIKLKIHLFHLKRIGLCYNITFISFLSVDMMLQEHPNYRGGLLRISIVGFKIKTGKNQRSIDNTLIYVNLNETKYFFGLCNSWSFNKNLRNFFSHFYKNSKFNNHKKYFWLLLTF